nr:RecName: Full=Toxin TdII-2 [Tityus discrepans]
KDGYLPGNEGCKY